MVVTAINNIIYGGAIENAITKDAETLGGFMLERLDAIGDRPILVDGLSGLEVTATQFKQIIIDFARNLRALGIKEGDRVGICSENRMEFAYCMFGTLMLNATLAPYNVTYTEHELKHASDLSEPKVIFASMPTIEKVVNIARESSFAIVRICFDDCRLPKGVIPYSEFTNLSGEKQPKEQFKPKPTNVEENVVVILCSSGTTGLPKGVQLTQRNMLHIFDDMLLGIPVIQGYAMTESLNVLEPNRKREKPGSVGSLSKGTQAKIIDTETGRPLGPNQPGEMCFKSNTTMKSYVGNKKATDELIDKDGWVHTGDIGYYDEDFDFFVVDRIKELIKYKGHQVAPAELEGLLLTNPKIKEAAVIGIPDEESGELPMAFVVKEANTELTKAEIMSFVEERVSPIKKLRGGVRFIDEIPKNSIGKILRRTLRDLIKKEFKSKL